MWNKDDERRIGTCRGRRQFSSAALANVFDQLRSTSCKIICHSWAVYYYYYQVQCCYKNYSQYKKVLSQRVPGPCTMLQMHGKCNHQITTPTVFRLPPRALSHSSGKHRLRAWKHLQSIRFAYFPQRSPAKFERANLPQNRGPRYSFINIPLPFMTSKCAYSVAGVDAEEAAVCPSVSDSRAALLSPGRSACFSSGQLVRVPSSAILQCLDNAIRDVEAGYYSDLLKDLVPIAYRLEFVIELAPERCVQLIGRHQCRQVWVESHLFRKQHVNMMQARIQGIHSTLSLVTGSRKGEMPL